MSEEEKEAIKYMKEFQKDLYGASSKNLMASYLDTIFNLIEQQQKEIEELIELLNKYNDMQYIKKIEEKYISKDKIREKIKEYDKWIEKGEYTESLEAQRYALNELLEE